MRAPERPTRPARYSLRWRLPLLISSLIVVVLATFLWAAYREVERNLTLAAGARALGAADQLALLMAQSTQQRLAEVRRAANLPVVRRCLERPSDESCATARASLSSLAGTGQGVVDLWSRSGWLIFSAGFPATAQNMLPPGAAPAAPGVSALQVHGDTIFSEAVAQVDAEAAPGAKSIAAALGSLVVRRPAASSPSPDV